jgi:hypothetical protein
MTPQWWTCGCGERQFARGPGTPVCDKCGKAAAFTIAAPVGQSGFVFGDWPSGDDGRTDTQQKGSKGYANGD